MNTLNLRRLVECAIFIAIGTVLSIFKFKGPWALGGSLTICSMLPLVMISKRHGVKWGVVSALVYSLIQLLLGLNNVQYAPDALTAVGIIMLDYVLAYLSIGFAGCFGGFVKDTRISIIIGIVITFSIRFLCHFLSGVLIWEALWKNELNWASSVWSLAYNASYMLPETIITCTAAYVSFAPLKRFWLGEDLY